MNRVLDIVDYTNRRVGAAIRWLVVGMMLCTTYEVIARYAFNAPTVWAHQTVMLMGGAMLALSWGWIHLPDKHVGIDIFYRRLPPRRQAIARAVCTALFLFPLLGFLIYISVRCTVDSWVGHEKWIVSIWQPPMWPSRAAIMLGFILFFLQGTVDFVRNITYIAKGSRCD